MTNEGLQWQNLSNHLLIDHYHPCHSHSHDHNLLFIFIIMIIVMEIMRDRAAADEGDEGLLWQS